MASENYLPFACSLVDCYCVGLLVNGLRLTVIGKGVDYCILVSYDVVLGC